MYIICIQNDGNMQEKKICNKIKTDKDMINLINNELDIEDSCRLLYTWKCCKDIYKSFGMSGDNEEMNDETMINKHKLPPHGYSESCEQESSKINLYSNIYIVKSNNENVFVDCLIDGYCSFYGMLKQMYDSEDIDDNEDDDIGECGDITKLKLSPSINKSEEGIEDDDNMDVVYDDGEDINHEDDNIKKKTIISKKPTCLSKKKKTKKKLNIPEEDNYELNKNMKILCNKRKDMIKLYYSILKNKKVSTLVEESVFNYTIDISLKKNINKIWSNNIFLNLYLQKNRSIYSNINSKCYINNKEFKKRVKTMDNKELLNIANMSVYDIYPDNWKHMLEERSKRDKLKSELKPEAMTDMFKCNKCGSRSTSYYEVQTRSADEPMTQFITCLDCGCRWKQ